MPAIRSSKPPPTTRKAPTRSATSISRASPEGRATIVDVVARTADQVFAPLTVGGGVRSVGDAERLLDAGADKIAINTAAIRDAGARARHRRAVRQPSDRRRGRCRSAARAAGRSSATAAARPRASTPSSGAGASPTSAPASCSLTSMDRDGTGTGYDLELIRAVATRGDDPVIASGGVGKLADLARRPRSRRRCRARRVDLSLRPAHDRRGQGLILPGRGSSIRI